MSVCRKTLGVVSVKHTNNNNSGADKGVANAHMLIWKAAFQTVTHRLSDTGLLKLNVREWLVLWLYSKKRS